LRKILFISSKRDVASSNMRMLLLRRFGLDTSVDDSLPHKIGEMKSSELYIQTFEDEILYLEDSDISFSPDLIIFLSRHSSKKSIPSLTVHVPGNIGEAKYGGSPHRVGIAYAGPMLHALRELIKRSMLLEKKYDVCYEPTHHGPTLSFPSMFVEVGSDIEEWSNISACETVVTAALAAAVAPTLKYSVLGIGGPHYNHTFTKYALKNDVGFSHIIPKYAVENLSHDLLSHILERTVEPVEYATIEWKSLSSKVRRNVISLLEELGVKYVRV